MTASEDLQRVEDGAKVVAKYWKVLAIIFGVIAGGGGGYDLYDKATGNDTQTTLNLVLESNQAVHDDYTQLSQKLDTVTTIQRAMLQEWHDTKLRDSVERAMMQQMHEQVKKLGQQNIYGILQ
jgi:hypothetical protein